MTDQDVSTLLEVWKKTIDVQQHFNDIELRIRSIAITLVTAVIGGAGVALKDGHYLLGFAIFLAGLIAWFAFFLMDYVWYHPLLKGSVKFGVTLESKLRDVMPAFKDLERGLTGEVGAASPFLVPNKSRWGRWKGVTIRSADKMRAFYTLLAVPLIAGAAISLGMALFS